MKKIGIFGFGNMGQAIYKMLKEEKKFDFFVCSLDLPKFEGVEIVEDLGSLCQKSDLIFLCVKPQEFYQLEKSGFNFSKKLIIVSIMAGVPIAAIKDFFSTDRIIRTMPNLNMQIGKGVIGCYLDKKIFNVEEFLFLKNILEKFGGLFCVKKEKDLNAITAVSGSGPAYVFLFYKALFEASCGLGFSKRESAEIVTRTIRGSLDYLEYSGLSADELIKKISSKKGTTEAALKEICPKIFLKTWAKALGAAQKRAEQLSEVNRKK